MEETADIEMELTEEQKMNTGPPLFLKKLWKMVNDEEAEQIIRWNKTENGFIILDQFEFATKLLPRYFRHNNMSSFIRQLNFYNFHKVPSTNQEIEFTHACFMKGVPELMVLIKRKNTGVKPKVMNWNEELKDFFDEVKKLQNKNAVINKELKLLKQENMTLWSELSSLRLKYDKQSSIINKLINFLISYIHTHRTSYTKENMGTPRSSQSNIKASPKLLELGYKNKKNLDKKNESYMFEPGTSNSHGTITYSVKIPDSLSRNNKNMQSVQDILSQTHHIHNDKLRFPMKLNATSDGVTYSINWPADESGKIVSIDIQQSLFDLLRENERLSIENPSQEILTEIDRIDQPMECTAQEFEPAFSNTTGNSYYTVSYPKQIIKNMQLQRDTPVITPLVQSPPADIENSFSAAPPEFSKIPKTEPIVCNTDHNYVYPIHSERKPKQIETQLHSNIPTFTEIGNNNQSKASLSGTAQANSRIIGEGSKVNQSLLENRILSSVSSLGMQTENSMVLPPKIFCEPDFSPQENIQSSSPIIEMPPEVEVEYIVEAPDSNSNPGYEVMECTDVPEESLCDFQNTIGQVFQHSVDQSRISSPPVHVESDQHNIASIPYSNVGKSLDGRNMAVPKNTTNLAGTGERCFQVPMTSAALGTQNNITVNAPSNYELTRNMESSLLKSGNQTFHIVNASSKIPSEYIVQACGENSDLGINGVENAGVLGGNLNELLDTMVPRVDNSIRRSVPPMSSVLPKKINTLSNPTITGTVVHRASSANSYPIKNSLSLSETGKQKLQNVRMKLVKALPDKLTYQMEPAKYPSAAGSAATLRSLKIPDTKSAGIDVRMKESLLEILKEQERLSSGSPNENVFQSNKNSLLRDQILPIVEKPAEAEILQQPNSNWNPANMEMEYTPEFPDDNLVLLDSLEPVVQNKVSRENSIPPLVSIGSNISKAKSILKNHGTNEARVKTAHLTKKSIMSGSESEKQSISKSQRSQAIHRGIRNDVYCRKRNNPASSSNLQSSKIPKAGSRTISKFSPIFKTSDAKKKNIIHGPDLNFPPKLDETGGTKIDENPKIVESTGRSGSKASSSPTSVGSEEFNILENTNSCSETNQEDLNILEEILNTLESKDLNDILSTDLNIDNLGCLGEENPIDTNICQDNSEAQVEATTLLDSTESVDRYFSTNFFDQNV